MEVALVTGGRELQELDSEEVVVRGVVAGILYSYGLHQSSVRTEDAITSRIEVLTHPELMPGGEVPVGAALSKVG